DSNNPSVVTLMIVATNTTDEALRCSEIQFVVPVSGNGALTTRPGLMKPRPDEGTKWSIASDQNGTLTAMPIGARPVIRPKSSIAFLVDDVEVATGSSTALIDVHETVDDVRTGFLSVNKVAPGLAITSLTAAPISVEPDGRSTIVWTTTAAV